MASTITFSLLEGQQVTDSADGQLIVLPCRVTGFAIAGIDLATGSGDKKVLTKIRADLPPLYQKHPDTVNFPFATLRDVVIRSVLSVDVVHVDLIYKAPGPSTFTLEDISQPEYLRTFTFADGTQNIQVWYKPGNNSTDNTLIVPPAGLDRKQNFGVDAQRYFGKRILKASGWMKYADWQAINIKIRTALLHTNYLQWGSDPDDATGTWLFQSMRTWTNDFNITKNIELYFIKQVGGHYVLSGWFDELGNHPPDGVFEATIRAKGPPPLIGSTVTNGIFEASRGAWQMNGISLTALYKETIFDSIFTFSPDQA